VGQKLRIQPPGPVRIEEYRVRSGDTVAEIARRFGVPVRDVLTANGLQSRTVIRPGQRLVVYVL
jgi:membrane-bound lytic murein transglycosylase D